MVKIVEKLLRAGEGRTVKRLENIAGQVNAIEEDFAKLTDAELRAETDKFKQRLAKGETLDDLLQGGVEAGSAVQRANADGAADVGAAVVEGPRGETVCVVEGDGARLRRFHLRTASYANWPALAAATAGELLPDFPLINKSFELCYACVDR